MGELMVLQMPNILSQVHEHIYSRATYNRDHHSRLILGYNGKLRSPKAAYGPM